MLIRHATGGQPYAIRTIRPEDRDYLVLGLSRMSPETRYNRFHTARTEFSDRELDFLVRCDGVDHMALVAMPLDANGQENDGVGVARFFRDPHDPVWGEVAVVVVDEWQNQGVGRELLKALAHACRENGVIGWRAELKPENERAIHLFAEIGDVIERSREGQLLSLNILLDPQLTPIMDLFH